MGPDDIEFQLRHFALPYARMHGESAMFLRTFLWLVVTLPPMLATAGYVGVRLLRWANKEPEHAYTRRLWLALWTCGFVVLATGAAMARIAWKNALQP